MNSIARLPCLSAQMELRYLKKLRSLRKILRIMPIYEYEPIDLNKSCNKCRVMDLNSFKKSMMHLFRPMSPVRA